MKLIFTWVPWDPNPNDDVFQSTNDKVLVHCPPGYYLMGGIARGNWCQSFKFGPGGKIRGGYTNDKSKKIASREARKLFSGQKGELVTSIIRMNKDHQRKEPPRDQVGTLIDGYWNSLFGIAGSLPIGEYRCSRNIRGAMISGVCVTDCEIINNSSGFEKVSCDLILRY